MSDQCSNSYTDKTSSKTMLYLFATYFRTLYAINQDFTKLCGLDAYRESLRDSDDDRIILMRILTNITRVLPYSRDRQTGDVSLNKKDALMSHKNHINLGDLEQDYLQIINNNKKLLSDIKQIRNCYEHSPHISRQIAVMSSSSKNNELFSFAYQIKQTTYEVKYSDLQKLLVQMNTMFDDIRDELVSANEKDGIKVNFKLVSMYGFSLRKFNKIYKSDILNDVGRIMWPV